MKRPPKSSNVIDEVRKYLEEGAYIYVGHANERLQQREVTRPEVKQVLKSGYHEKKKDEFKEEFQQWNYSINGKTLDEKNLRVAVSFDDDNMLVITVIDLDK